MILNWIEGSIFLVEFAPNVFVKAMLRGSVIPKCMNLATVNGFVRCLCWDFALHLHDKTNFIFWGFFQNFFHFYYLAVLMERTNYCKFWGSQVTVKSCPILVNIQLLCMTPC